MLTQRVQVRFDTDMLTQARAAATARGLTFSSWLRILVADELAANTQGKGKEEWQKDR